MRLDGSGLLVVAAMTLSLAAGCRSRHTDAGNDGAETAATVPEENPDTAPVAEATPPAAVEQDFRAFSRSAPPALGVEERGRAPGAGYLWTPGYYGWNGRGHVWHGGRWYAGRRGYEYVGPGWHSWRGRWGYRPGRWIRR